MDLATVLLAVLSVGMGVLITAMTWIMKALVELKVQVASASARQDATLGDHERRIHKLETT